MRRRARHTPTEQRSRTPRYGEQHREESAPRSPAQAASVRRSRRSGEGCALAELLRPLRRDGPEILPDVRGLAVGVPLIHLRGALPVPEDAVALGEAVERRPQVLVDGEGGLVVVGRLAVTA